jgi:hypothetical protein
MKFHLDYQPQKSPFAIDQNHKIMMMGSCFAENIGGMLREHRFNVNVNPSGIMFNPLSIALALEKWISGEKINADHFIKRGDEYFSFLHHSSVKAGSKQELEKALEQINVRAGEEIKKTDFLIITFGSAHYYYHTELGTSVANCHKQPGNLFEKRLLKVEEIVKDYSVLIESLQKANPKLKIIFTVSPVKYLRDGVVENNLSKSILILAVHELCGKYKEICFYFPAYELVNDDLRDYRFYKEDLAHPNEQAIKYIWEKFSETYFHLQTRELNVLMGKLNLAENHRPLNNNPAEKTKLEKHLEDLKEQIRKLNSGLI